MDEVYKRNDSECSIKLGIFGLLSIYQLSTKYASHLSSFNNFSCCRALWAWQSLRTVVL
jgi:hypothetical protein